MTQNHVRKYRKSRRDYDAVKAARKHWIEEGRRQAKNELREAARLIEQVSIKQLEALEEMKSIVNLYKAQ